MPSQSYPLTLDQFTAYLASLPGQGFNVMPSAPTSGQVGGRGCLFGYSYDGTTLTVTAVSKSGFASFMSWPTIFGIIGEHLEGTA